MREYEFQRFKYKEYESTIKTVSQSDRGENFIESDIKVYDFDKFTADICNCYRDKKYLNSVDAFAVSDDNEFLFIEFKNVRKSHFPKRSVSPKAFDSIYIAQFFLDEKYSIDFLKEHSILIVVYNDDAVSETQKENKSGDFEKIKKKIGVYAQIDKESEILFNLEKYKGILYKDIFTISKKEFMNKYALKCNLIDKFSSIF